MKPVPLQNQFNNGMKRDMSRNRMPPNSCWNMVDMIPDYDAPARGRSGWSYNASSVTSVSATYITAGIYATFSLTSGAQEINVFLDEDWRWWKGPLTGTAAATGIAQYGYGTAQNPVFHGGAAASAATAVYTGLVIMPEWSNTYGPLKFDGTTVSALGGSPPAAKFASVYKDYTVLGNGKVSSILYPNRIWWSPPGDPDCGFSGAVTAWDTTDSWNDFSLPVVGMASTKNVLLVYHDGQISRIRGNTPPPEEDMVVDDPWQKIGLLDPFSITEYQDQVYWCAPEGVYGTDGVSLNDLTLKGGMLKYWLDLVKDATSSWTFATGVIRNKLIISVMNGSTFVDSFMIDLQSYAWVRLTNITAKAFWSGQYGSADETYMALIDEAKTARLSTMFLPGTSAYAEDGDGTYPNPTLEPPFFELGRPGIKTVKAIHIGNYMKNIVPYDYDYRQGVEVWYTDGPEQDFLEIGTDLDFQRGITGWTSPQWTLSQLTTGGRYGMEALKSTAAPGITADSNMAYANLTFPKAGRWTLTAWVYLENTWNGGEVYISPSSFTGSTTVEQQTTSSSIRNQWQRIQTVVDVLASDLIGYFAFYPLSIPSATASQAAYFDGVRIIKDAKYMGYIGAAPYNGTSGPDGYDRKRLPVGGRMYGIGLQLKQFGAGDLYGYDFSAEVGFQEESKRLR